MCLKILPGIVERGMTCLNNEKFWGAPEATRAVIWTLLPGAGDGKPDPYQTLKQSMQIGENKGVRLSHALYAVAAQASGEDAKSAMHSKPFLMHAVTKNL